jgi:hypothetical protein
MLVASVAVTATMLLLAAWIEGAAVQLLTYRVGLSFSAEGGDRPWYDPLLGVRSVMPFLGALAVFGACWWLAGRLGSWYASQRGELDAWFIARFGWTNTSVVHFLVGWLVAFLRYVVALSLSLAFFVQGSRAPLRSFASRWIRAAFSPARLLSLAVLLLLLFWLPWRAVYWKPGWLNPNWQEVVFVALKLGLLYIVAHVGWALGLLSAASWKPRTVAPRSASGTA